MLCAGDAGIESKSVEGLAKGMTSIVAVFEAAGLTVSEKKTEIMLLRTPSAAGQRCRSATQLLYLGGLVNASADIMPDTKRRVRLAWPCYKRSKRELYDMEAVPFNKCRGDGDPAVRVCNADPRQGALRRAANGTPQV